MNTHFPPYDPMERLNFSYSFDVNRQIIYKDSSFDGHTQIRHDFYTSYGNRVFGWEFDYCHYERSSPSGDVGATLHPMDDPIIDWTDTVPESCNCKFTLKRANQPNLEHKVTGIGRDYRFPTFIISWKTPLFYFFENFVNNPKELPAVLSLELEIPKAYFDLKVPSLIKVANDGWEQDKRYKILTINDKHDFHFVCKDGIFYAKKRHFIRMSNLFQEDKELKNKSEMKLDISLEAMKVLAAYMFTEQSAMPKNWNPQILSELLEHYPKFCMGFFAYSLDIIACCELGKSSHSLFDLVSWWKAGKGRSRLQKMVEMILNKKYYNEIMDKYKADATLTDPSEKQIHNILHNENSGAHFVGDKSLFNRVIWFHEMSQKVIVTELPAKK